MSGGEDPRDADVKQANWQLNQGLKTCRSVIDNYRSMLSGESVAAGNDVQQVDLEAYARDLDQPNCMPDAN